MKIIIIGSGISGMAAAIQAAEKGIRSALLSPYSSERAQSVMAAGGINASLDTLGEGDTPACHAEDTLKSGCYLENEEDIRSFCDKAPENVKWIESMGVVFSRDAEHRIALRAFGGQTHRRTAYAGASTGKQIVTALVQKCREYEIKGLIERKTGLYFHSALIKDGTCHGVLMTEAQSGKVLTFYGDAVIMAVGGQNKLFGKTTGSELCDGYAAGKLFEQGVELRNLEFIQYHPTAIETPHKRMLISEAARGEGGRLYYVKDGKRCYFMEELYGARGNLMPRDIVSKCIYDCPSQVYLDITFLGEAVIHKRLQEICDLCREFIGLDATKESIPVVPAVHFFMGGIAVDRFHETNVKNLYAVGECASKYHGANRLGGNSLLAAVHSGRTAANHICEKSSASSGSADENAIQACFAPYIAKVQNELPESGDYPAARVLNGLASVMNRHLGIVRNKESLEAGLKETDALLCSLEALALEPTVPAYESYRLKSMVLLSKAMLMSALARKETRGAHIRTDYPETSPEYRKCSYAKYENGEIHIAFRGEAE